MMLDRLPHQTIYDAGIKDPVKIAAKETRSLAELTHIARAGINARGRTPRIREGGPPLEHGLAFFEPRTYPPSWA